MRDSSETEKNNRFRPIFKHAHRIEFQACWMPCNFRFFTFVFVRHQPQNITLGSTSTA